MHDPGASAVPPWSRRTSAALAALVLAMLASLPWLAHGFYEAADDTNDAAMYVACARALLAGEGYAYLGQPFTIRPPGLSALIAPLIALRGVDFGMLHLFVSLCGVAACALLFAWARFRVGTPLALALAACVWLNPAFQLYSNRVLSDVPGAAALFACLLLARRAERRPSLGADLLLGATIGLACYVRSISVLLVPAVLAARLWAHLRAHGSSGLVRFARERALAVALVALVVLLPWSLRNAAVQPAPPVDQNFIHSYSTAMWHVDGGDPSSPRRSAAEILGRIPRRAGQTLAVLGSRMQDAEPRVSSVALGGLALAALLFVLRRRREPAELFALAVVPVLLLYFGFRERLVLPLYLIALPASADALAALLARAAGARVARGLVALAVALLALLDLDPRTDRERAERTDRLYRSTCAAFAEHLAPDAVLAAPVGWHYAVYLDRPVYSLFFAVRRADDMQAAERVIDRYGINTVVLSARVPADQAMLPYFEARYAGRAERSGESYVFRVRE